MALHVNKIVRRGCWEHAHLQSCDDVHSNTPNNVRRQEFADAQCLQDVKNLINKLFHCFRILQTVCILQLPSRRELSYVDCWLQGSQSTFNRMAGEA